MKEDLMRRISVALDSDEGIASDPALQQELRANPDAQKYAKDLTRLGKWLGTWPLPEPDDAAFESLAQRIEQRLDESLSTMSDPTAPPVFDDDDALRDATANLLSSGEYQISDSAIQLIPEPETKAPPPPAPLSDAKPLSPIAKVTLSKARVPTIVEESSVDIASDPRSAELDIAALDIAALGVGAPKKKKKRKKSATSTSGDRISIPTPKPTLGAPTMSPSAPVVQLPRAEERKPAATLWWFAAAAAVGLGVFGGATLFDTQGSPALESGTGSAHGSTLVTSGAVMPTTAAVAPAMPPPAPPPVLPPTSVIAEAAQPEAEIDMQRQPERARAVASPTPSAARGATGRLAQAADDVDGMLGGALGAGAPAAHHAARSGSVSGGGGGTAGPVRAFEGAPTTTAPAAAPRPAPAPEQARADLPSAPDRSTIQAVLAARADAVSACANGAHGLADVDIVISGSGRITTATVNGSFAGTAIGSCIARAVRAATFPPFAQPRFQVTYPYHL